MIPFIYSANRISGKRSILPTYCHYKVAIPNYFQILSGSFMADMWNRCKNACNFLIPCLIHSQMLRLLIFVL